MLKASFVLGGIAIFLLLIGALIYDSVADVNLGEATGLAVSLESFPVYLETHPLFKDLPKSANVEINLGENNYAVSGKSVTANVIADNPDLTVNLPERYVSRIGEVGLCSALKEAIAGGEIEISTELSKLELFMKYRKLIKYRDCLTG